LRKSIIVLFGFMAVVADIAIPNLKLGRMTANETAAKQLLRG
jgi:hypothetical protein